MPKAPFSTLLVTKIAKGEASPLSLGLVSVTYSTPVFHQIVGDDTWVKNFSNINSESERIHDRELQKWLHLPPK